MRPTAEVMIVATADGSNIGHLATSRAVAGIMHYDPPLCARASRLRLSTPEDPPRPPPPPGAGGGESAAAPAHIPPRESVRYRGPLPAPYRSSQLLRPYAATLAAAPETRR